MIKIKMETKTSSFGKAFLSKKRFALVEIAIVLCSVFLGATLPGLAAESSVQKVSASEATTASEDDFTLDIYGNANEDDTIDMGDVVYIKLAIFGEKPKTELCDANYDGKVSMLDVGQTSLIILGKERELTIVDSLDRIVTLNMPIERIASSSMPQDIRTICALGAEDKIVGVPETIVTGTDYPVIYMAYPELAELPIAGTPYYGSPNLEVIASLEPDLVLVTYTDADAIQEATGIPTIVTPTSDEVALALEGFPWLMTMGHILNKQERAEELISYFHDKLDEIEQVTSDITDDEKKDVYLAFWGKLTYTPTFYGPVEIAGGRYVAEEGAPGPYSTHMWEVSKEQVIAWNPDIIILHAVMLDTLSIEDVLSDPDLQTVSAVQNEEVYATRAFQFGWDPATGVSECFYLAKLFYPDEFVDLNVEEKGNEVLKEVYGIDGIWTEMTEHYHLYEWE